jgi:hypothetical protein
MSKSKMDNQVLTYLVGIKEDVAGIKEHLRTLNGKVIKQEERIQCLELDSIKNKISWAKLSGVILSVSIFGSIVGNKIFELILSGA